MVSKEELLQLVDYLRRLIDQVSYNASADDLQSFPIRTRQIEAADKLRVDLAAFRNKLAGKAG